VTTVVSDATVEGIFVDATVAIAVSTLFCTEVTVGDSGCGVPVVLSCGVGVWLGDGSALAEGEVDGSVGAGDGSDEGLEEGDGVAGGSDGAGEGEEVGVGSAVGVGDTVGCGAASFA